MKDSAPLTIPGIELPCANPGGAKPGFGEPAISRMITPDVSSIGHQATIHDGGGTHDPGACWINMPKATGAVPMGTVATTALIAVSRTETVFELRLAT